MPIVFDGHVFYDDSFDKHKAIDGLLAGKPTARARVRLFRVNDDTPLIALVSDDVHLSPCHVVCYNPMMASLVARFGVDPNTTLIVVHHRSPGFGGQPPGETFCRYHDGVCGVRDERMSRLCRKAG